MKIIRADGSEDIFDAQKLKHSLERAGADEETAESVSAEVARELKNGMTTGQIYGKAFAILKRTEKPVAARYSLKQAIMEMGPTGYPFEQLWGRLLEKQGYQVSFPEMVPGKCVGHEVDVVAEKDGEKIMVEAKFHNQPGFRTDVRTTLYVKARCEDLNQVPKNGSYKCWLVTNTKFTHDAIQYGKCAGMELIGWGYPHKKGLESLLEETGLLPVTIMMSFSKAEKRILLDNEIVVCRDIAENPKILRSLGINQEKIKKCAVEAEKILEARPKK